MYDCICDCRFLFVFFFKQKTAYEMRISDWSSDVCSSDLLREQILQLSQASARVAPDDLARLDTAIGRAFAEAAEQVIEVAAIDRERIVAIGPHGQTLRHNPGDALAYSMQLGDPNQIAERCAITTVPDFRRRDVAPRCPGPPLTIGRAHL